MNIAMMMNKLQLKKVIFLFPGVCYDSNVFLLWFHLCFCLIFSLLVFFSFVHFCVCFLGYYYLCIRVSCLRLCPSLFIFHLPAHQFFPFSAVFISSHLSSASSTNCDNVTISSLFASFSLSSNKKSTSSMDIKDCKCSPNMQAEFSPMTFEI